MSWRRLIQQLMNQEHVIRSLEDSAPIRKAAKYTVYLAQRGKQLAQESLENIKNSDVMKKAEDPNQEPGNYSSFKDKFANELEKGFQELKDKHKKGGR